MPRGIDTGEFLSSLIVLDFDLFFELSDPPHMFVASYDVLKVLKQTRLILILSLSFHQGDLFDLTLQDEETIVLKVDALGGEEFADLLKGYLVSVDTVSGLAGTVDGARDLELGTRHHLIVVRLIFVIIDVLEEHFHRGMCAVLVLS